MTAEEIESPDKERQKEQEEEVKVAEEKAILPEVKVEEKEVKAPPSISQEDSVDSTLDAEVSDAFSDPLKNVEGNDEVPSESRRERMLKRLSYPMESITSISRILTSSPKSFVDFSGSLFTKASEDEDILEDTKQEMATISPPLLGYKNEVEEKPEIFEALDRLLSKKAVYSEQEEDPLYLCLRMGIPKVRKPHPSPVLSYGKKRARSEYWFSIPHNRVEDLYNFLQHWIPHFYGDVEEVDPEEAGFETIDDSLPSPEEDNDEEEKEEEGTEERKTRSFLKLVEDHFGFRSISPSDWEVLSLGEMEKVEYSELELPLPELLLPSEIFTQDHIKQLYLLLPARAVGYPWTRIFSTASDGFNLKTLYRKMTDHDGPILIAIQDTNDAIFGCLLSCPLRPSDHFYGTGESFLYTFQPEFKVFKWTGDNMYFVKGDVESVAIGAGEGLFGLWLDGDLYRGRSSRCKTYDNDPLASEEDFVIRTLEAWGFV